MDLANIKGLGEKNISILNQLGIFCIEDLLEYYPYRYECLVPSSILSHDDKIIQVINVIVEEEPRISYIKRNFNTLRFRALFQNQLIQVSIFNRAFLKSHLKVGNTVTLVGKYNIKKNNFIANDIKLEAILVPKISSVYHLAKGLKNNQFEKWIFSSFQLPINLSKKIPISLQEKYHFISKLESLQFIHFPKNSEEIKQAKLRLIYEELFEFMFKMMYLKEKENLAYGLCRNFSVSKVYDFIKTLPFPLTEDQRKAVNDGLNDLQSKKRMNRLILGDVGSGKTIVAIILMYANVLSGYQSVLMAPTEILAKQHYSTFLKLFESYSLRVELLIGSMKPSLKKQVIEKINNGEVDFVIGTHALLNEKVEFANLGLVVTDEQHRFGVNQRRMLQNKGYKSDVLYLSATPIPRTYALTIYGDMDMSMISAKPSGRKSIITKVKKESELKEVLQAIYEEIKLGHQIYVVAPLIEDNEDIDLKDVNLLKEKFELAFRDKVQIEILHGKMNSLEKEKIMNLFQLGKVQILISTTVIEVGVDVKASTMMVIFNAERFGLATLHQLRGRVGRNDLQSYCYLISNQDVERLKVLEESNDGFYISEKDFELRGQGDLFGVQQSGDMSFKIADLKRDYKILLQAKKDVVSFLNSKEYQSMDYYLSLTKKLDFTN